VQYCHLVGIAKFIVSRLWLSPFHPHRYKYFHHLLIQKVIVSMHEPASLKRSLNLPLVVLYGLGNILGAGVYVLIGKVAGEAGFYAPMAFIVASVIAALSAFSYAELSARYPVSAGEAVYIFEGFQKKTLSQIVGILIIFAGIASSAAIAHGFYGYMIVFFDLPAALVIIGLITALAFIAAWGIQESVTAAAILTVLEVAGLLLIIFTSIDAGLDGRLAANSATSGVAAAPNLTSMAAWVGISSGAFLAFYAYIGFEDMVNIAEEVKHPESTMPKAIMWCLVISSTLYAIVAWVAITVLDPTSLSVSSAPLADVYSTATGRSPVIITIIGLFAVVNGALIQIIMASRLAYGMATKGLLPSFVSKFLGLINPRTRTPVNATIVVALLIMLFCFLLPLVSLAELTSYLVLTVFSLVNLSLIKIKHRDPTPVGVKAYPTWLPKLGFATSSLFLLSQLSLELMS
jgi:APA family basic amino acid/polyamine antiporter